MADDYWREAVEQSLEDAGITATAEQIENVAGDMGVSHEQHGMAFGHDVASANPQGEKDRTIALLRKELKRERDTVACKECCSTSHCWKCNGERRHDR